MNAKLWVCIGAAVLVAHIAVLFIVDHWRKLGQPLPPPAAEPTFSAKTLRYVDESGHEVMVERQYKVSTKFATDEAMSKLAPPPTAK